MVKGSVGFFHPQHTSFRSYKLRWNNLFTNLLGYPTNHDKSRLQEGDCKNYIIPSWLWNSFIPLERRLVKGKKSKVAQIVQQAHKYPTKVQDAKVRYLGNHRSKDFPYFLGIFMAQQVVKIVILSVAFRLHSCGVAMSLNSSPMPFMPKRWHCTWPTERRSETTRFSHPSESWGGNLPPFDPIDPSIFEMIHQFIMSCSPCIGVVSLSSSLVCFGLQHINSSHGHERYSRSELRERSLKQQKDTAYTEILLECAGYLLVFQKISMSSSCSYCCIGNNSLTYHIMVLLVNHTTWMVRSKSPKSKTNHLGWCIKPL